MLLKAKSTREIVQKNDEPNLYTIRTRHVQMDHMNTLHALALSLGTHMQERIGVEHGKRNKRNK